MSEATINTIMWLIPVGPLAAAIVIALLGPKKLGQSSHLPCWIGLGLSAACALILWWSIVPAKFGHEGASSTAAIATGFRWLDIGGMTIDVNLRADAISALMLTMVTTVSTLVSIFAAGYMHGDPGYPRFFGAFSLFVFSMVMLVLSPNFLQLYVFWEGVGLCSYLLIGFWYRKPAAAAAAKKAFVVNRIGDFGFLMGIFLIWTKFGSLDFERVLSSTRIAEVAAANPGAITTICLLLLLGAMGKSAQFPLHVWLPDAMEGPTPVSALIHAATMVTAGVYLVARSTPLFLAAPDAHVAVSVIGAVTALLAALIALTQNDLKRVLAYSTVSQLAYMFMALGAGAAGAELATPAVAAGMFHLVTHGFFKALLFIAAGSVMHSMGDVIDMRRFSGLRRALPITHWTFLCGAAALAGFPLLDGFWSKDEILSVLSQASRHERYGATFSLVFWIATVTAFLTAFYTFRAYFLTFWGKEVFPSEAGHHPHDAPPIMAWPLRILAVAAVVLGVIGGATHAFAHYLSHAPGLPELPEEHLNIPLMIISSLVVLAGIGMAWRVYGGENRPTVPQSGWMQPLYELSLNKFYLDELYYAVLVAPLRWLAHACVWFDNNVIDRTVDLVGAIPRWVSAFPRYLQEGVVPSYALMMWAGLLFCVLAATAMTW
jgi:NADH-quinone oxidoreductase subunit L